MVEISYPLFKVILWSFAAVLLFNAYMLWLQYIKNKRNREQLKRSSTDAIETIIRILQEITQKGKPGEAIVAYIETGRFLYISPNIKSVLNIDDLSKSIKADSSNIKDVKTVDKERIMSIPFKDRSSKKARYFVLCNDLIVMVLALERNSQNLDAVDKITFESLDHEIMTPLGALTLLTDMIHGEATKCGDLKIKAHAEEAQNTLMILNSFLKNLAAIVDSKQSGNVRLNNVDSLECVKIAFSYLAKNYPVDLHVLSSEKIYFAGDVGLMVMAIANLVKNAYTHSKSDRKKIAIILTLDPDNVLIHVGDRGIGISKNEIPMLFNPSFRGKNVDGSYDGHGIGLFIVSNIVRLHRGELSVHSIEKIGTVFTIKIPKCS